MLKKVLEIQEAKLTHIKDKPGKLKVITVCIVPSGGWSSPQLIPYVYLNPPSDGIYDFDLVAKAPAPEAAVIRITTPMTCTSTVENIPDDLKGIKIHTSTNAIVVLLEPKSD